MTREEYIRDEVRQMVYDGVSVEVAEAVAEVAWNLTKWQYER